MFDLITIGDCGIDTYLTLSEGQARIVHKGVEPELCLPFGAKLPVGPTVSMVAGNAANNVIAMSKLGLKTAIYTNISNKDDDEADDRIKARLKLAKVDLRYVVNNKYLHSNHNIILSFGGERTILSHHEPWDYKLPELERTKWVYLTSLSGSFLESNLIEEIVNFLERSNARLAFQPGTLQIKAGLKKYGRLLSKCAVLVVNFEEAKELLGHKIDKEVAVKSLLQGLADFGIQQVVITDGAKGSYGFDGEQYYQLGVFPAKLVEMTGSGDAYASGLVAGLFHGELLSEAMRWGAANSASVVEQVGPQAGLLSLSQIKEKLESHPKIKARNIQ